MYKYSKKKKHVCREYRCPNCREKVLPKHQCYIQPLGQADEISEDLEDLAEAEAVEKSSEEEDEEPPPLVCCIDFECGLD